MKLLLLATIAAVGTADAADIPATSHSSSSDASSSLRRLKKGRRQQVKTTLCSTHSCNDLNGTAELIGVCKTYLTSLHHCYNAKFLFPDDESWSDVDILDELYYNDEKESFSSKEEKAAPKLQRTFYKSTNSSCRDVDYSWIQPFEVCEGPFGFPRPWGKFSLVDELWWEVLKK
jgi:hypothetical protein